MGRLILPPGGSITPRDLRSLHRDKSRLKRIPSAPKLGPEYLRTWNRLGSRHLVPIPLVCSFQQLACSDDPHRFGPIRPFRSGGTPPVAPREGLPPSCSAAGPAPPRLTPSSGPNRAWRHGVHFPHVVRFREANSQYCRWEDPSPWERLPPPPPPDKRSRQIMPQVGPTCRRAYGA